jgi:ABC-type transporter Mla maintaining outer membrane lipid asymmetry ATPase subunit MlaF
MQPQTQGETVAIDMIGVSISSLQDQALKVIENVDWRVRPGDYWVVAGLQGSGKSDFLMTTAGLAPPAEGTYRLYGEVMPIYDEARMATRLRVGLVFDGGQLFNHLTVRQNISLAPRYHGMQSASQVEEATSALIDTLELSWAAKSRPGALGRNWQKRVGLARALALKPELLLVDNPLAGLDLRHMGWWLQFLDALARGHDLLDGRPLTLVVTAADLRPWKRHARQFAVLRERRLVVLGSWTQLEAASAQLLHELLDEQIARGESI